MNEPTWKEQRDARRRRERAEDAALADALDRRDRQRLGRVVSATVATQRIAAQSAAERRRVAELIRQERVAREREEARLLAEIEVREGQFVNLADTVVAPTDEWLRQGDSERFTPRQPDGTVREVATVRRVLTPVVARLHAKGKITDDQFAACMWYRDRHEVAGLEGRFSSSKMSDMPSGGGSGFAGPMAATVNEAMARRQFRSARDAITPFYLILLDLVVLLDTPPRRAAPAARCPRAKVDYCFRTVAQELADHCEEARIDLQNWLRGRV